MFAVKEPQVSESQIYVAGWIIAAIKVGTCPDLTLPHAIHIVYSLSLTTSELNL